MKPLIASVQDGTKMNNTAGAINTSFPIPRARSPLSRWHQANTWRESGWGR